ncbi:recombinase family protein [Bacillus sp. BRMEA1]|nr:recombinase family protein [Neobacillus endophyticus]
MSSKKQVSTEDDIPMQRNACLEFIQSNPDWELTNELYEKGLSGWKLSADDRDELVKIREAAENKQFDVLLVFMFDRLGRREQETPFVVQFLVEKGIEVWSAKEGQARIEDHADILINFIRFWQASGESKKISIRSREAKEQRANKGDYQGGPSPFGYKCVDTEKPHWKVKGKFIKIEVPDENESEIVKLIFDLYVNRHYGYRKICDYLNENGFRGRDGNLIGISSIQRYLSNPVYIGRRKYKSYRGNDGDTMPYKESLRIIPDEMFEKAQEIKAKRRDALHDQDKTGIPLSGKLMFSGLAFCECCGSRLSANYIYRDYKKTNGDVARRAIYRYRCPVNKGAFDHEQNIWGSVKYDKIIISHIKVIMRNMDISVFIERSIDGKKKHVKTKEIALNNLQKEADKYLKQLSKLNEEIAKSLLGDSQFTPDQLSAAISSINEKINTINESIDKLEKELESEKENYTEVRNMAEELKNWEKKFDGADNDLKKVMLSRVIHKVYFGKDRVNVEFNDYIEDVLKLINDEREKL